MLIQNIIFDWSGTISDDFGVLYDVVMDIFDENNVKRVSREEFLRTYTLPYMAQISTFFDISKEKWDIMFREKWTHKGHPRVFPQAKRVLDDVKSRGITMTILTSHPKDFLMREINSYFPGSNYFDDVFADAYDKRNVIHSLMSKMNFVPQETLFVGDTVHDIETGKHAGVITAAILTGYNTQESLQAANPDFFLHTLDDLTKVLG